MTEIDRRLAARDPLNASTQRDLGIDLIRLAQIPGSGAHWRDALAQWEAMEKKGILSPADQKTLESIRAAADAEDKAK